MYKEIFEFLENEFANAAERLDPFKSNPLLQLQKLNELSLQFSRGKMALKSTCQYLDRYWTAGLAGKIFDFTPVNNSNPGAMLLQCPVVRVLEVN